MIDPQTQSTLLQCPHCHDLQLVRHIDIKELPEIFVFYCLTCQHAEARSNKNALPRIGGLCRANCLVGWTAGVGIAGAFTGSLTARIEYLFARTA
jgi:hypothetical protein